MPLDAGALRQHLALGLETNFLARPPRRPRGAARWEVARAALRPPSAAAFRVAAATARVPWRGGVVLSLRLAKEPLWYVYGFDRVRGAPLAVVTGGLGGLPRVKE